MDRSEEEEKGKWLADMCANRDSLDQGTKYNSLQERLMQPDIFGRDEENDPDNLKVVPKIDEIDYNGRS